MFGNDNAFVSTRCTFINTAAAAGGAALFGTLASCQRRTSSQSRKLGTRCVLIPEYGVGG